MNIALPLCALAASSFLASQSWRHLRPNPPTIVLLVTLWVAIALPRFAESDEFAPVIATSLRTSTALSSAIAFSIWAGAAVCTGLAFAQPRIATPIVEQHRSIHVPSRGILVTALLLLSLRLVLGGPIDRYGGDIANSGTGYAAYLPHVSASLVLSILALMWKKLPKADRFFALAILIGDLTVFWNSGVRFIFIAYFLATLTMFKFKTHTGDVRRFRVWTLALGVGVAIALLGALGNSRTASNPDYGNMQRAVLGTEVLSTSAQAMQLADVKGVLYGQSYLDLAIQPIPRAFWPDKPRPATQLFLYSFTDPSQGRAITAPVEAYINLGFIGALILLIVIGWSVGRFIHKALATDNDSWAMTVYVLTSSLLVNGYFRGYAIGTMYQMLFVLGPLLLLGRLYDPDRWTRSPGRSGRSAPVPARGQRALGFQSPVDKHNPAIAHTHLASKGRTIVRRQWVLHPSRGRP